MINHFIVALFAANNVVGTVIKRHEGHAGMMSNSNCTDRHEHTLSIQPVNKDIVFVTVTDYTTMPPTPPTSLKRPLTVYITHTSYTTVAPSAPTIPQRNATLSQTPPLPVGTSSLSGSFAWPSAPAVPGGSSSAPVASKSTADPTLSNLVPTPSPPKNPYVTTNVPTLQVPTPTSHVSKSTSTSKMVSSKQLAPTTLSTTPKPSSTGIVAVPITLQPTATVKLGKRDDSVASEVPGVWILSRESGSNAEADYRGGINPALYNKGNSPHIERRDIELTIITIPIHAQTLGGAPAPKQKQKFTTAVVVRPTPQSSHKPTKSLFTSKTSNKPASAPTSKLSMSPSPILSVSNPSSNLLKPSKPKPIATPTPNDDEHVRTIAISEDSRCPYPYPGIHCGKPLTKLTTETKKASETEKDRPEKTGWCPYPYPGGKGSEC